MEVYTQKNAAFKAALWIAFCDDPGAMLAREQQTFRLFTEGLLAEKA